MKTVAKWGWAKFPKLKKAKRRMRATKPEDVLQHQCEHYLELLTAQGLVLDFLHIPESMWRGVMTGTSIAAKSECADYLKSWPDLLIFLPGNKYVAIELKTEIGKVSRGQRDKLKILNGSICRGFEEFKSAIDKEIKNDTGHAQMCND